MNKKLKQKWIKALRSGEYARGTGKLVTEGIHYDKFCCMGVLADVIGAEFEFDYDGAQTDRCRVGSVWLSEYGGRLDTVAGDALLSMEEQMELASRNDRGWPFKRIANWIEKNL